MGNDGRLTRMLHLLLHIHLHDGAATSETLAVMLGTNPVVVRRTMAGLRDAGHVRATKGPGGGWRLAREPERITVLDVCRAIGIAVAPADCIVPEHPGCPVERAVNDAVSAARRDAEAVLLSRFRSMTLADLLDGVGPALSDQGSPGGAEA